MRDETSPVPVPTSSEEITVPIAAEAMAELVESDRRKATSDEHSKDAIALERGIKPIEP